MFVDKRDVWRSSFIKAASRLTRVDIRERATMLLILWDFASANVVDSHRVNVVKANPSPVGVEVERSD